MKRRIRKLTDKEQEEVLTFAHIITSSLSQLDEILTKKDGAIDQDNIILNISYVKGFLYEVEKKLHERFKNRHKQHGSLLSQKDMALFRRLMKSRIIGETSYSPLY